VLLSISSIRREKTVKDAADAREHGAQGPVGGICAATSSSVERLVTGIGERRGRDPRGSGTECFVSHAAIRLLRDHCVSTVSSACLRFRRPSPNRISSLARKKSRFGAEPMFGDS